MPTSTARLVFVDTETTSLRPDRRAWEVALIVRTPGEPDAEFVWMVHVDGGHLSNADLYALRVGRFHDRHPAAFAGLADGPPPADTEWRVAREVERLTRGAHLVGAVPNFDAEVLAAMLRRHGLLPAWHYHLIDVEALAVGYLAGATDSQFSVPLPWSSEELSRAVGVEPAPPEVRHTALGDARWARDVFDAVTRQRVGAQP
jgi:DNA polymerase III epsilon subunit-like protein